MATVAEGGARGQWFPMGTHGEEASRLWRLLPTVYTIVKAMDADGGAPRGQRALMAAYWAHGEGDGRW